MLPSILTVSPREGEALWHGHTWAVPCWLVTREEGEGGGTMIPHRPLDYDDRVRHSASSPLVLDGNASNAFSHYDCIRTSMSSGSTHSIVSIISRPTVTILFLFLTLTRSQPYVNLNVKPNFIIITESARQYRVTGEAIQFALSENIRCHRFWRTQSYARRLCRMHCLVSINCRVALMPRILIISACK